MPELAIYVLMVFTLSALTAGSVELMRGIWRRVNCAPRIVSERVTSYVVPRVQVSSNRCQSSQSMYSIPRCKLVSSDDDQQQHQYMFFDCLLAILFVYERNNKYSLIKITTEYVHFN